MAVVARFSPSTGEGLLTIRESDAILAQGKAELSEIATSMLKQKIAALVFLPWLSRYTERVRDVAKQEERDAILSIPDLSDQAKALIREWAQQD